MNTLDPGVCSLRWCDETAGHDGPHRKQLFDGFAMDVRTGRPVIVQTWLQGESARVRGLVVVAAQCEVGLTWPQTKRLADVLATAGRRWSS